MQGMVLVKFSSVYMELLDFLSTSGVEITINGAQKFANINETGYMPRPALLEKLGHPKTGTESLSNVKVEQGEAHAQRRLPSYRLFPLFDAAGKPLWNERASNVLINGADPSALFWLEEQAISPYRQTRIVIQELRGRLTRTQEVGRRRPLTNLGRRIHDSRTAMWASAFEYDLTEVTLFSAPCRCRPAGPRKFPQGGNARRTMAKCQPAFAGHYLGGARAAADHRFQVLAVQACCSIWN